MLSQPKINLLRLMRSSSLIFLRSLTKIVFLKISCDYVAVLPISISPGVAPGMGLVVPKPVFGTLIEGTNYKRLK